MSLLYKGFGSPSSNTPAYHFHGSGTSGKTCISECMRVYTFGYIQGCIPTNPSHTRTGTIVRNLKPWRCPMFANDHE